jgi:FlaA1/EpsC-like NDP-sugar epimerase
VGFLDNNPYSTGRQIHGVGILGDLEHLEQFLNQKQVDGVLVTQDEQIPPEIIEKAVAVCRQHGRWVRTLRLEFELVG